MSSNEQFKILVGQVLQSYGCILNIQSSGGTATSLTKELQSILYSYEQMQNICNKLSELSEDDELINSIRNIMRDPFLTTLKMQMSLLSLEDVTSNQVLIKDQANLTITTMNQGGSISKLEDLSGIINTSYKTHV